MHVEVVDIRGRELGNREVTEVRLQVMLDQTLRLTGVGGVFEEAL